MKDFTQRFEFIYLCYSRLVEETGSKPSESGLARFLGVPQPNVNRWKKYQFPDPVSLKLIHDKLGFAYDWLISGEGEMMDSKDERIAELEDEVAKLKQQAKDERIAELEDEVSRLKRQVAEASQARDGMGKAVGQE